MANKFKILLLLVGFALTALFPVAYNLFFSHNIVIEPVASNQKNKVDEPVIADLKFQLEKDKAFEPGAEFNIVDCKVIDGYRFYLSLDGGNYIIAHLTHATKNEATQVVVDLLKNSAPSRPSIILRRKTGDFWIVDLFPFLDGKKSNLVDILRTKDLLL